MSIFKAFFPLFKDKGTGINEDDIVISEDKQGCTSKKSNVKETIIEEVQIPTIINPQKDNTIIKFDNASIYYPNSIHSGEQYTETEMGVFKDPVFVETDNSVDVCGVFTEKVSDGYDSFYYRTNAATFLIRKFENEGYVYPIIFVKDANGRYKELSFHIREEVKAESINMPIFILRAEPGFYYIDARSDFKLYKVYDWDYNANTIEISEDGNKLFVRYGFTRYGGSSIGNSTAAISSEFRSFDISEGIPKLEKHETFDESTQNNVQPDLPSRIHYYFTLNSKTAPQIAFNYAQKKLRYRILKNEFDDDETINVDVVIDVKDITSIAFFRFIQQKNITNYSIYGISAIGIINTGVETFDYGRYLSNKVTPDLKDACVDIINLISLKYGLSENDAVQYIWNKYCPYEFPDIWFQSAEGVLQEKVRGIYNEMKAEMVANGELATKWKSEVELYKLVRECFGNVIYQYREKNILGLQSLDIFVPKHKLAFEYQGIQHYKPVELFGGEAGFKERKRLDAEKRQKCSNNNILLIEWKYTEPISKSVLKKKLKDIGIIIK